VRDSTYACVGSTIGSAGSRLRSRGGADWPARCEPHDQANV